MYQFYLHFLFFLVIIFLFNFLLDEIQRPESVANHAVPNERDISCCICISVYPSDCTFISIASFQTVCRLLLKIAVHSDRVSHWLETNMTFLGSVVFVYKKYTIPISLKQSLKEFSSVMRCCSRYKSFLHKSISPHNYCFIWTSENLFKFL